MKYWSFINLPWDMSSPKKKLCLINSAVLTFIGYKQTNIQAKNEFRYIDNRGLNFWLESVQLHRWTRFPQRKILTIVSITLPFLNPYRILTPSLSSSIPIYPSPFPSSIPLISFPLPFLNPSSILPPSLPQSLLYTSPFPSSIPILSFHPSSIPILFFPRSFINHYSILPPSPPQSLFYPSPFPYLIPIESLPLLFLPQSLFYPSSPFLNHYSILHPPLSSIPILSFTLSFLNPYSNLHPFLP